MVKMPLPEGDSRYQRGDQKYSPWIFQSSKLSYRRLHSFIWASLISHKKTTNILLSWDQAKSACSALVMAVAVTQMATHTGDRDEAITEVAGSQGGDRG